MSIFNQRIKQGIDNYKENLRSKDGNTHILLIESVVDNDYKYKKIYMKEINDFLDYMQDNNYEIIDIKLNISAERSMSGYIYETMIIYK